MERPFVCGFGWLQISSVPLFCGTSVSLFSLILLCCHLCAHLQPLYLFFPLSVSLFIQPPTHTYLSSFIFHCCLSSLGARTRKAKCQLLPSHAGVRQRFQFIGPGRMRVGQRGWLQAVFKGLERTRLKLDFHSYVFLRQQHGRPLKTQYNRLVLLCSAGLCGWNVIKCTMAL